MALNGVKFTTGTDALIQSGTLTNLDLFTIWGWVRPNNAATRQTIFSGTTSAYGIIFWYDGGTGPLKWNSYNDLGAFDGPAAGQWVFFAFTRSTAANTVNVYLSAENDYRTISAPTATGAPAGSYGAGGVILAAYVTGGSYLEPLLGDMCGVGIANRILTAAEINAQKAQLNPLPYASRAAFYSLQTLPVTTASVLACRGEINNKSPLINTSSGGATRTLVTDGPNLGSHGFFLENGVDRLLLE